MIIWLTMLVYTCMYCMCTLALSELGSSCIQWSFVLVCRKHLYINDIDDMLYSDGASKILNIWKKGIWRYIPCWRKYIIGFRLILKILWRSNSQLHVYINYYVASGNNIKKSEKEKWIHSCILNLGDFVEFTFRK